MSIKVLSKFLENKKLKQEININWTIQTSQTLTSFSDKFKIIKEQNWGESLRIQTFTQS